MSDARDAVIATALAAAGGFHLVAAYSHRDDGRAAVLFGLVAATQLVWALPRSRWRRGRRGLVVAAGTLAVVTGWVVSRTVGLGALHRGGMETVGLLDGAALVAELVAIAGLVGASSVAQHRSVGNRRLLGAGAPLVLGVAAAVAVAWAAPPPTSPAHVHRQATQPGGAVERQPVTVRALGESPEEPQQGCDHVEPVCSPHGHP